MKKLVYLLLLFSCSSEVILQGDHDPVINIEATFFSGEPISIIHIRQSFNTSGKTPFVIPADAVQLSGASVTLTWNGQAIEVVEQDPGIYQPISPDTIREGDVIEIYVEHNNRWASAKAEIPDHMLGEIEILPTRKFGKYYGENYCSELPDSVYQLYHETRLIIPLLTKPKYVVASYHSLSTPQALPWCSFYFEADFTEWISQGIELSDTLYIGDKSFSSYLDELDMPAEGEDLAFAVDIRLPEDIYATYLNTLGNPFISSTVTNVENGVGLFIGCQKVKKVIEVPVHY